MTSPSFLKHRAAPSSDVTSQPDGASVQQNTPSSSPTSTVEYEGHEPFDTLKRKVLELCRTLWPSHDIGAFSIERMEGGSSNRVIGFHVAEKQEGVDKWSPTVTPDGEKELSSGDYVLRIPRFLLARLEYGSQLLRLGSTFFTSIDLPRVLALDANPKTQNPLGVPYALMHRIPGKCLTDSWDELNHQPRLSVAAGMARFFIEVQKAKNPTLGVPNFENSTMVAGRIPTTDFKFLGDADDVEVFLAPMHPVDMLCARLNRWGKKFARPEIKLNPRKPFDMRIDHSLLWFGLVEMVKALQTQNGIFGPEPPMYYFHHGDLFPRNIMVEVTDQGRASVIGILDWDEAHFAPAVIAFAPPAWLWVEGYWKDDEEDYIDEDGLWEVAENIPESQEAREIKDVFERGVGPQFLQHAYSPDARAVREIWSSVMESIGKTWVINEIADILTT